MSDLTKFNDEQRDAVLSTKETNVIISAGAGSGKTRTLTEKVYSLIADDRIPPSRILAMTFTNKAAHEMKEKIIARFRSSKSISDQEIANEIQSAHIETFDAFFLYLTQKYASALSLPRSTSVLNDTIGKTKEKELLDEIFNEYYADPVKGPKLLKTLKKFNFSNDGTTKNLILDLRKKLNGLLASERDEYLNNYDEKFLSPAFFQEQQAIFIESLKRELTNARNEMCLAQYCKGEAPEVLAKKLQAIGQSKEKSILEHPHFDHDLVTQALKALDGLIADSDEGSFLSDFADYQDKESEKFKLFNGTTGENKKFKKDYPDDFAIYDIAKFVIKDPKGPVKGDILSYKSFAYQCETLSSFKDDIHIFFDIVKELNDRYDTYKRSIAQFEFGDIASFALSLLTDPQYAKEKEEIINQFDFILVDEYQDTNDSQEAFLKVLSSKATIFAVGDVKQSIYGFRGTNCGLFIARKENYRLKEKTTENGKKFHVIEMNKNYRSVKKVLLDINTIFDNYMRHDHGGVDYSDEAEYLHYDEEKDVYASKLLSPNGEYGINLLTYDFDKFSDERPDEGAAGYEALAIIDDIQKKIASRYQVLGEENVLRDCQYSDFCVIVRKKSKYDAYQRLFQEFHIPLNVETSDHLTDIDAILTLQSLIGLTVLLSEKSDPSAYKPEDLYKLNHYFMSVARSYLYFEKEGGYTDSKIDAIVRSKDPKVFFEDAIVKDVLECYNENKDSRLSDFFLALLKKFKVIEKLYEVGQVENNLNKIESFYRLLLAQESMGSNFREIVDLFDAVSKNKIELETESVSEIKNAVTLITIHKMKGDEKPIVYLPTSCNGNANGGGADDNPDYLFSRHLGLILKNYWHDGLSTTTFLTRNFSELPEAIGDEAAEHVRLLYVAFTRAKESIYVVSSGVPSNKKNAEDPFSVIFKFTPTFNLINEAFAKIMIQKGAISNDDFTHYLSTISLYDEAFKNQPLNRSTPFLEAVHGLYEEKVLQALHDDIDNQIANLKNLIIDYYFKLFKADSVDNRSAIADATWKGLDEDTEFDGPEDLLAGDLEVEKVIEKAGDAFFAACAQFYDGFGGHFTELATVFKNRYIDDVPSVLSNFSTPSYDYKEDDSKIQIENKEEKRASKIYVDPDVQQSTLDYGTYLHRLLELTDFKTKDVSIIQEEKERNIIANVLKLPLFANLQGKTIYKEYAFFDEEANTSGFIDCLIVDETAKEITIIDYKTKNINDEEYVNQLGKYEKNISAIFKGYAIKKYLLSILEGVTQEIK
jgi:ATP-dependent helicase/nuclease subunit A